MSSSQSAESLTTSLDERSDLPNIFSQHKRLNFLKTRSKISVDLADIGVSDQAHTLLTPFRAPAMNEDAHSLAAARREHSAAGSAYERARKMSQPDIRALALFPSDSLRKLSHPDITSLAPLQRAPLLLRMTTFVGLTTSATTPAMSPTQYTDELSKLYRVYERKIQQGPRNRLGLREHIATRLRRGLLHSRELEISVSSGGYSFCFFLRMSNEERTCS